MTVAEAVRKAAALLAQGPHPDRARRDAETLLVYLLHHDRATFITRSREPLGEVEALLYAKLVERRTAGEPIQYILGQTEFYGLPLRVTPAVLIPRPETEHLVEKALELATALKKAPRIADVGTGSGAIAIALAHHLPAARMTAIDLSAAALELARENARLNGVEARIRFLEGDLLAPVQDETFELIVSNPPYVPLADQPSLSVEVRDFEPGLALFAGTDGLEIYRRLIPQAFEALAPGGHLLLEIGYGQRDAVAQLLAQAGFEDVDFLPDLQQIPRVACGRRPAAR